DQKAAGGVLTAKQAPAGPAPPRRSVCAPAAMYHHSIADQPGKREPTMSFRSWLLNLRSALVSSWGQRSPRPRGSPRAATYRPSLEVLEDRTVPSTFTVLNLADSGAGSLRQAVLDANTLLGPDIINFADGLSGRIDLSGNQMGITDSLTINGPGAAHLTINGS